MVASQLRDAKQILIVFTTCSQNPLIYPCVHRFFFFSRNSCYPSPILPSIIYHPSSHASGTLCVGSADSKMASEVGYFPILYICLFFLSLVYFIIYLLFIRFFFLRLVNFSSILDAKLSIHPSISMNRSI